MTVGFLLSLLQTTVGFLLLSHISSQPSRQSEFLSRQSSWRELGWCFAWFFDGDIVNTGTMLPMTTTAKRGWACPTPFTGSKAVMPTRDAKLIVSWDGCPIRSSIVTMTRTVGHQPGQGIHEKIVKYRPRYDIAKCEQVIQHVAYDERHRHVCEPLLEYQFDDGLANPCQPIMCFAEDNENFHLYVEEAPS